MFLCLVHGIVCYQATDLHVYQGTYMPTDSEWPGDVCFQVCVDSASVDE